jgi:xanthine dehydrogenase accessory factor
MEIYQKAIALAREGRAFAFATVIRSTGSTPQKAGAKAIFESGGEIWGTLGGGCLEAESRRRALTALDSNVNVVFDLSLDSDYGWDDGLICGGNVRVFVDVFAHNNCERYAALVAARERRETGVLEVSVGGSETTSRWLPESKLANTGYNVAIEEERALHIRTDESERYIEAVVPTPRLLIAGGGHVGRATAKLGAMLGFEVTVVDDRAAFANKTNIPDAHHTICDDIEQAIRDFPMEDDTYVVIVTRGHQHDADALAACVSSGAAFVGMIGSKRKLLLIRKQFVRDGICSEEQFDRVYSPIGFDIGAQSIEEIAVSIAAQLTAVRRKHSSASKAVPEPLSL